MNNKFKVNILAVSVFSALTFNPLSLYAAQESADIDNADDIEIINVKGIRNSQRQALLNKRNADSIMDSIAAEDIGKFPDQNISESLQRIPGITISRAGGEGQQITVRGMGPEHNTVLLNGRVLATENEGREFNFDVLASELLTGLDVYKAPTANLQEGGIGSTVNMKTARPLNYDGLQAVVSAKAHYDANSGATSPQYSGMVSNSFMDGKVGLLGSFNYYDREFKSERAYTDGFERFQSDRFTGLSQERRDELSAYDGEGYGEGISMGTWYQQDIDNSTRKRLGGTLAAQWQINDDLLLTVDGIYSKLDVNSNAFGPTRWVQPDLLTDVTVDTNGTVVGWESVEFAGTEHWAFSRPRYAETKQMGFNSEWQASNDLALVFDVSHSTASNTPVGKEVILSVVSPDASYIYDLAPGATLPTLTPSNFNADVDALRHNWAATEGTNYDDTTDQITLDAIYTLDDSVVTAIYTGVSYVSRDKSKETTSGGASCGAICDDNNGFYPSGIFTSYDASDYLDGNSAFENWVKPDFDGIIDILKTSPDFIPSVRPRESGSVKEETTGAYVQANLMGDIGDMPWSGNVGVRYNKTDVQSIGENQELLGLDLTNPNDPQGIFSEPTDITDKGSYSVLLPSVNFKLDVHEDVSVRAAIGKTITRPTLSLLALKREWNLRPNERNLRIGNPSLKPLMAWNYDLSVSWFIDDVSFLSAAYFHKKLSNDFQQSVNTDTFFGDVYTVYSVENKGDGKVDGFELSGQYTFSQLPEPFNGLGVSANYTDVIKGDSDDDFEDSSQSYNVAVFYEQGAVQARIAYNFRDGYVSGLNANRGQPKMIDDFGQLDASASYDISENLSIFAEASNITNEQTLEFSIYKERMIEQKDTGSRYSLGLRYTF